MESEIYDSEAYNERPILEKSELLKSSMEKLVEKFSIPNRQMIKQALECSRDCFSSSDFTLEESYDCQKSCLKPLDTVDRKSQIAFGRYDAIVNGCLHSCSKQKRKSPLLSNESIICYNDCLNFAKEHISELESHLNSIYSQFIN